MPSVNRNADWWKWHLLLPKWEEGVVCPVNQWVAAAQGTERVVSVVCRRAHGQEVLFSRLSFFHVWTLGRTSDMLAWLEPKIFFFFISFRRHTPVFHSHFLQDYRNHLEACAVQLVIYLWYGLYSIYIFTWSSCYTSSQICPSYTECIVQLSALGLVRFVSGGRLPETRPKYYRRHFDATLYHFVLQVLSYCDLSTSG